MAEPRIILFDIETLPDLEQVMSVFTSLSDYPGQTLKASINSVIVFGYKVFGEKKTHCINAWDFPNWKKNINDDSKLVEALREILVSADAVVTHNGRRFDWKFIQTRMLKHNLKPLPNIPHIDTCSEAKKNLLMFNNRLNTIAKFMTTEEKLENGGWSLWQKVMQKDPKSMKLMSEYCMKDVDVLEAVFKKLRPFIKNIPNHNIFQPGKSRLCPSCGGTRLQKHGVRVTKISAYQRYHCMDCGSSCSTDIKDEMPRS